MGNESKSAAVKGRARITVTHEMLDEFLTLVVAAKGPGAEARAGQRSLAHDSLEALLGRRTFSGVAPPGTGKSFAYLCCAALLAAAGGRVMVSTEMLGLQRQLIEDDLPLVTRVLADYLGVHLKYASFTGVSHYVDPGRLLSLTEGLTAGAWSAQDVKSFSLSDLHDAREVLLDGFNPNYQPVVFEGVSSAPVLRELALWGLDSYLEGGYGDDVHMLKDVEGASSEDWALISATADDRLGGADLKGFTHKFDEARARALVADIVVANHALVGIEAVAGGGVVMENKKAGSFGYIIVDEAHSLPASIRNAGDGKVSGYSFREIGSRARNLLQDYDIARDMSEYGAQLDNLLHAAVQTLGKQGTLRIEPSSRGPLPLAFVEEGVKLLDSASLVFQHAADQDQSDLDVRVQAKKVQASAEKLRGVLKGTQVVQNETSDTFVARWVESKNNSAVLRYTPIPVEGLAREALWHKQDENFTPRGVVCVSATLPRGFGAQMGVAEPTVYPSPFAVGLSKSAVFVPYCPDPGAEGLLNEFGKFNTAAHPAWASKRILDLVLANEGRALVVSATNAGAARYAHDLQQALRGTGITVFNQAEGRERSLAGFRADERSVLVGVKSYMTGIDVKGESLSLMILDRPPRSPGNVTDDARVERVMYQKGCSRAEAMLDVYVADAAGLLDQARGRLLRHGDDVGMVAVLDPRLSALWPLWYNAVEQSMYLEPLREFGTKLADLGSARAWLQNRRRAVNQESTIIQLQRQLAQFDVPMAIAA
jgi:ATP-dependent DNA helicase DinG